MIKKLPAHFLFLLISLLIANQQTAFSQDNAGTYSVTENGVLVETKTGKEVSFFGTNYSVPFAHSFRALVKLGKDHKKAIDADVYHFARLNFDAFRMHIWDAEISDSLGNITPNKHLDLLDYLLSKLEERNIKVILTPLTFYDNAYPDGATPTEGFANYISKGDAPRNKDFYPVIKNYLDQFLNHKNPYTGKTYIEDPNIIATEIINEPSHWGDQKAITDFINEMADHVRDVGWEKPVFYNIAQNPGVVDAVMSADVDGLSFQWYPAGLVGGKSITKNYMPHVNNYPVPFRDGEGFSEKAMMVYEFDAADNRATYSYPMMARSFREAGFQWATQFAYDPLPIAPYNSDYPTHYLNLAYTPGRALSMLIASEIFHQVPRRESFDNFLSDTLFYDFRVSHSANLSEYNSGEKFYYTNDTGTDLKSVAALNHIAGTGSSPVINYEGSGAYFLDKMDEGVWRLEVFPDAIRMSNPFARPSFDKKVTRIAWDERAMKIQLPGLGDNFTIQGMNDENALSISAEKGGFAISPGTYLLRSANKKTYSPNENFITGDRNIGLKEFYAPEADSYEKTVVSHFPQNHLISGKPATIQAIIVGTEKEAPIQLVVAPFGRQGTNIMMQETKPFIYEAEIPAEYIGTGVLRYWISIGEEENRITFPGAHPGYPWAWNYYYDDVWTVPVLDTNSPIQLFSASKNYNDLDFSFSPWFGDFQRAIQYAERTGETMLKTFTDTLAASGRGMLGWSRYVGDVFNTNQVPAYNTMSVRAAAVNEKPHTLKIIITDNLGIPYTHSISVNRELKNYDLKLDAFTSDKMILLPRPYPTFLPFWFEADSGENLKSSEIESIQMILVPEENENLINGEAGFEVSGIWLKNNP